MIRAFNALCGFYVTVYDSRAGCGKLTVYW